MSNKKIKAAAWLCAALIILSIITGAVLIWRQKMNNNQKFRVVISTDFPPLDTRYPFKDGTPNDHKSDPDDIQSMVRFLLYSNEFDVEGLIASSATFAGIANKQNIIDMLDIYDSHYETLKNRSSDYPSAEYLKSVTYQGNSGTWGRSAEENIGENMDSEASDRDHQNR